MSKPFAHNFSSYIPMPTAKKMIVRSSSKPTAAPPPKKRPASATTRQQEDGLPDEQAPESERPTKRVRFTADLLVPDEATNDGRGEDGTNPPTSTANNCNVGTFDRVSDEVLRTRRIVRTTLRLKGNFSSAEIAPPFGGTASCRSTNVKTPSSFSGGGCGTDVPTGVNPTEEGENTPPPAEKVTAEDIGTGNAKAKAKATCGEIIDLTDLADSDDDEDEASLPPKKDDNAGVPVFDFNKDGTPEASDGSLLEVPRPTTPGCTTGREQGGDTPADTRLNPTTVANRIPVGTTPRHDDNPTARQDTTPNGRTTLVNRERGLTNHHHPTTPLRTPVRAQPTLAIRHDTKPVRTTTPTPRSPHSQTYQPGTTVKPPRRHVEDDDDDDEDDCWSVTAVCNGKMGAPPMGRRRSSSRSSHSSRSSRNSNAASSSSSAASTAAEAALAAVPTLETGQPILMNWYILPSTHQRGRFVIQGDVYGSSRFVTGGSLTTSVIESGNYHEGGLVRTGNGTVYRLGCAMRRGGGL